MAVPEGMTEPVARQLTLYVESRKVVSGFYRPPSSSTQVGVSPEAAVTGLAGSSHPDDPTPTGEAFFLSDDQARCVALTEELAARRGYQVEVTDLGRTGRIGRVLDRVPAHERLPLLVGAGGSRLEGIEAFTEDRLCEMMPAELGASRAFTYLKVRGGDLERIRSALLALPEIRELHYLTGDWDVLAVLEFPGSERKKRQVLEFVTARIRAIHDVVDTSTLVPEVTVTKFPFSGNAP